MRASILLIFFFFFKQKTAYEMRISDWSSDVCSSDLDADQPESVVLVGKSCYMCWGASRDFDRLTCCDTSELSRCPLLDAMLACAGRCKGMVKKIGRASCRERVCQYV